MGWIGPNKVMGGKMVRQAPPCNETYKRRGYSLFELLLVLAILCGLAAVAAPNVLRYSREQALVESGARVQGGLASARLRAIETGVDYQFRYEPGGDSFVVIPLEVAKTQTASAGDVKKAVGLSGKGNGAGAADVGTGVYRQPSATAGMLERLVTFEAAEGAVMEGLPEIALRDIATETKLADKKWSRPLVFRSTGSASNAVYRLRGHGGAELTIEVRGLTGATKVGSVTYRGKTRQPDGDVQPVPVTP
jgi:prepilin-type N-terminal cleavage/methylation domain-containing protein